VKFAYHLWSVQEILLETESDILVHTIEEIQVPRTGSHGYDSLIVKVYTYATM